MRILCLLVASIVAAAGGWAWPTTERDVVRAFQAPSAPWGPGHRGVDLAATAGAAITAPANGTVWFVGVVVDRPVISILHENETISSFEPVEPLVAAGEAVVRGQVIGTLVAGHAPCGACVHFGVRVDGEYVNPMLLLGAERAVLLPLGARARGEKARHARGCAMR